jgi:hypothetical protein
MAEQRPKHKTPGTATAERMQGVDDAIRHTQTRLNRTSGNVVGARRCVEGDTASGASGARVTR